MAGEGGTDVRVRCSSSRQLLSVQNADPLETLLENLATSCTRMLHCRLCRCCSCQCTALHMKMSLSWSSPGSSSSASPVSHLHATIICRQGSCLPLKLHVTSAIIQAENVAQPRCNLHVHLRISSITAAATRK